MPFLPAWWGCCTHQRRVWLAEYSDQVKVNVGEHLLLARQLIAGFGGLIHKETEVTFSANKERSMELHVLVLYKVIHSSGTQSEVPRHRSLEPVRNVTSLELLSQHLRGRVSSWRSTDLQ